MSGGASLSISFPLFDRFQRSLAIAQADVAASNGAQALRRVQLEVEEQIRAAFVDLETAWAQVRETARSTEIANERLRIVQEEYQLATKDIEALRTAIREQASSLLAATERRYDFAVALVAVYEAAGLIASQAGLAIAQRPQD